MTTAVKNIIQNVLRKPKSTLNLLVFSNKRTEKYVNSLAKLQHNIFLWTEEYDGSWKNEYIGKPNNVYNLPNKQADFDVNIVFDAVISNNRFVQFDVSKNISIGWHIPQIVIHHDDLNGPIIDDSGKEAFIDRNRIEELFARKGDINIFDSKEISMSWNTIGQVIEPEVNSEFYQCPELKQGILINKVDSYQHNPPVGMITAGKIANELTFDSKEDSLRQQYANHNIFLTFDAVGINPVVLEAMSCGLAVVSYRNKYLETVIQNGHNGYIVNNESEMKQVLDKLYSNHHLSTQIGNRGRDTILKRFNSSNFFKDWIEVLNLATTMTYTR